MQDVTVRGEDGLPIVPAGETTQGQILAELQQKTEPADIQKVQEQTPLDLSTLAKESKQLPDNHQVTVSNPTADPETGLATSSKQDTQTTLLQGIAGFLPSAYDYFTYTSGSTTDTYVFKTGGSGGATVKTITITFVDTTKKVLSTVGAI